jgi:hypothetical protein
MPKKIIIFTFNLSVKKHRDMKMRLLVEFFSFTKRSEELESESFVEHLVEL